MCQSMVDIQPAAAEIRRGKKDRKKKIEITGQKYNGPLLHRATIIIAYLDSLSRVRLQCLTPDSNVSA